MFDVHDLDVLGASHDDALVALLSGVFGAHPRQRELLEVWRRDATRLVDVACAGGRAVGLMASALRQGDELDGYERPFGVRVADASTTVATFQTLVVERDRQREGVAGVLASRQLARLVERGATVGVGVSWAHGGFDGMGTSRALFERAGFTLRASSRDFYQASNATSGMSCSRCGPPRCSCEALLFVHDDLTRALTPPARPS